MSAARPDTQGERMARLETMIENMIKEQDRVNEEHKAERKADRETAKALASKVETLTDLLNQLKGARWTFAAMITGAGIVGGAIAKYGPYLFLPK